MKYIFICWLACVHLSIFGAAASESVLQITAFDQPCEEAPDFIRILGAHPNISMKLLKYDISAGLFAEKDSGLICFCVGHEDADARNRVFKDLIKPELMEQVICPISIEWQRQHQAHILQKARTAFFDRLPEEALVHPTELFIAAFFIRLYRSERKKIGFLALESAGQGVKTYLEKITIGSLRPSIYYVAKQKAGEKFIKEEHAQAILRRMKKGKTDLAPVLTKAFTNYLSWHKTFGFEIDHKALRDYFERPQAKL